MINFILIVFPDITSYLEVRRGIVGSMLKSKPLNFVFCIRMFLLKETQTFRCALVKFHIYEGTSFSKY